MKDYKLENDYYEVVSKYIDDSLADEIFANIHFVEKYLDRVEAFTEGLEEKQLIYKQMGIMVFSCVEALWKGLVYKINKNCENRNCTKRNCKYRKIPDSNSITHAEPIKVINHLVNTRLLYVSPVEYEALDDLRNMRNNVHLTNSMSNKIKSDDFNLEFVDKMLRVYYATLNQAELCGWYFDEENQCLSELDENNYDDNVKRTKLERNQYFSQHIISDNDLVCCFDDQITDEVVKAIAEMKPLCVVFRDSSLHYRLRLS